MKLTSLKASLRQHADKNVRFVLSDGEFIPADFHVTEVGHVVKTFIDCGGTKRKAEAVVLQTWVAENDPDHRLTARKLASILDLAKAVVPSDDLSVEVEYEGGAISQYPVTEARAEGDELRITLSDKHTDCLAREACGGGSAQGAAGGKCC